MSFKLDQESRKRLDQTTDRTGVPMSRIIRNLVSLIPWDDGTISPVLLKVPKRLQGNREGLRCWLAEAEREILERFTIDPPDLP